LRINFLINIHYWNIKKKAQLINWAF